MFKVLILLLIYAICKSLRRVAWRILKTIQNIYVRKSLNAAYYML